MGGYFYTVASLPYLSFETTATMSNEDFLFLCQNTISRGDWEILREVKFYSSSDRKTGNATYDSWTSAEQSLRAELAKLRAAKKGHETESYNRYGAFSQNILDAARKAFNENSPLEAETLVLQTLWALLDELEAGHLFDLDKLIAYYLRMQILELKNKRNKTDGNTKFSLLYESIVKKNPS